jgi:hypothetical protein
LQKLLEGPVRGLEGGLGKDVLLHLVELVDPHEPPHVLAGASRLRAEGGGVAGVALGKLLLLQDLPGVQGVQDHLRRAGQVEVGAGDGPDLVFGGGEVAGADEGRLPGVGGEGEGA